MYICSTGQTKTWTPNGRWEVNLVSRTVVIPMHKNGPSCEKCKLPAVAIYSWETKVFGRISPRAGMMCATCSVKVLNKISMYEAPDGERIFYKPNSNMTMHTVFEYERPSTVEHAPLISDKRTKRELSGAAARTLLRIVTHDSRVDPITYTGKRGLRRMYTVECSACHIKYARATRKKCPGCGKVN